MEINYLNKRLINWVKPSKSKQRTYCPETRLPDGPLAVELKSLELFVLNSVQLFGFPREN
jgi:hypothetical protein